MDVIRVKQETELKKAVRENLYASKRVYLLVSNPAINPMAFLNPEISGLENGPRIAIPGYNAAQLAPFLILLFSLVCFVCFNEFLFHCKCNGFVKFLCGQLEISADDCRNV